MALLQVLPPTTEQDKERDRVREKEDRQRDRDRKDPLPTLGRKIIVPSR